MHVRGGKQREIPAEAHHELSFKIKRHEKIHWENDCTRIIEKLEPLRGGVMASSIRIIRIEMISR